MARPRTEKPEGPPTRGKTSSNRLHRVSPGEPIHEFFETWKRSAAQAAPAKAYGLRQWFIAAAQGLAGRGYRIDLRRKWLSKGWLIWYKDPAS